ncbi:YhgE/Pip domain-containing protein [Actinoplanes sp. NPDC049802]|uniref:YhgE/Pip domain-containing protein n=1 Tax=Actinoplanes sp. NPDC049802 TaxID=3154742 RepID=UPI0034006052
MRMLPLPGLELSRLRTSPKTKAALLIVVVLPALYAGLLLAASWNPPERFGRLTAAVVNGDRAAGDLDAGGQLAQMLVGSSTAGFSWRETTAREAAEGLEDGRFAATAVIPASFSSDLQSVRGDTPRQAVLTVTTNDASNYVLGQVTNSLASGVERQLRTTTTKSYLNNVYVAFSDLHTRLSEAADGAATLAEGNHAAKDGSEDLVAGLRKLADGSVRLSKGTESLASGVSSASAGAERLRAGLASLGSTVKGLPSQTKALHTGAASGSAGSARLADGAAAVASGAEQVGAGAQTVTAGAAKLAAAARGAAGSAGQLKNGADSAAAATRSLRAGLADLSRDYRALTDAQRLTVIDGLTSRAAATADGATVLAGGLATLAAGEEAIATQTGSLADGAARTAAGAASVAAGATSLSQGTVALRDGLKRLSDGTATLAARTPALVAGIDRAAAAADRIATGAGRLSVGAADVAAGASTVAGGAADASGGATELDGGLAKLASGADDLAEGLSSGAEEVPAYTVREREQLSDITADPVSVRRTHSNPVSTYGEGLAPYFIPLALWIGGIVTYMILRALSPRGVASTARPWRVALAGYLPGMLFAALQAVALLAVLVFGIGVDSPHPVALVAFTILVALVFTAVHQSLVALFGGVGRLFALVLLMLQLASAGGTYPVETAPAFFRAISPWLPMTHAVDGFRHLIAGGRLSEASSGATVLGLCGIVFLLLSVLAVHRNRVWTIERLHPSLAI